MGAGMGWPARLSASVGPAQKPMAQASTASLCILYLRGRVQAHRRGRNIFEISRWAHPLVPAQASRAALGFLYMRKCSQAHRPARCTACAQLR